MLITFRLFCITKEETIVDIKEIETNRIFFNSLKKLYELFCYNILARCPRTFEKAENCYWFYDDDYNCFDKACIQILKPSGEVVYQPKFLRNKNIEVIK